MVGGEHSSVELTVSVKAPCQECGGRGYVETVTGAAASLATGRRNASPVAEGLIPEDMPLSQFQELLASHLQ